MKLDGFLFYVDLPFQTPFYSWYKLDMSVYEGYTLVGPSTIEVEIPEGFDLKETLLKQLQVKKEKLINQTVTLAIQIGELTS